MIVGFATLMLLVTESGLLVNAVKNLDDLFYDLHRRINNDRIRDKEYSRQAALSGTLVVTTPTR